MAESQPITPGRPSPTEKPEPAAALNLSRLLVALDGRTPSEMAIPFAAMVSKWLGSEITLFHVLPPRHEFRGSRAGGVIYPDAQHDRGANLATSYLQEVARRTEPFGTRVRWSTGTGTVPQMIAARAVTGDFGLIVLAAHPRSRMARKFRSTVLSQLWGTTSVPLFIVNELKMRMNGARLGPPKTIFVPCSGHHSAEAAFPYLDVLAPAADARVIFLRRIEKRSAASDDGSALPANAIDEAAELLRRRDIEAQVEGVEGELDLAVAERQAGQPGSWVIMGSRMRHGIGRSLFGSMADRILRVAPGPVMVVPTRRVSRRRAKKLHSESLTPPRGV
jgi:nucleotide-binding universal stress UspA family protein